jgi:predicted dehydrogenase
LEYDRASQADLKLITDQKGENMDRLGIGIIGCGNISEAYLKAASHFAILDIKGIADLRHEAAEARAAQFGLRAMSIDELLADPSIQIIVNLTIPAAHVEVGLKALAAGKHAYSEKPLGLTTAEARPLLQMAKEQGLRVGCAPDTFLGGSHQTCRKLIDEGAIGRPLAGSAFFMCPGHERWHPNPAFYYAKGGGPMLDMGPYYITALVNLLGPVARVSGVAARARSERVITSEPLKGAMIPVEVATHVAGTLEFVSGATVSVAMSFDVSRHRHKPIELYGTEGSLSVPDPNRFFGTIEIATAAKDWTEQPTEHPYAGGNYRIIGVADMAQAIRSGRPHRASGELAFHALEVMEAFQVSSDRGAHVTIESCPERPAMLPTSLRFGMLD